MLSPNDVLLLLGLIGVLVFLALIGMLYILRYQHKARLAELEAGIDRDKTGKLK